MSAIPRHDILDSSTSLLEDPYGFIAEECAERATDVFETRVLLRPAICMTGPRAAQLFYDDERFERRGATPELVRATLFGKGGVQELDGQAHRRRKAMFMSLLGPAEVDRLARLVEQGLVEAAPQWAASPEVNLYEALKPLLTRAVCAWAGVPLNEHDVPQRSRQLAALFEDAATGGLQHLQARVARKRAEHWIASLVRHLRGGRLQVPEDCALQRVALHKELDTSALPAHVAAVEMLNLLRPTVAVSVFMTFAAHALHLNPEWHEPIAMGDESATDAFVQEVRRFYPFFPAVVARTRCGFEWQGWSFPPGRRVLLDLYGTNHDARFWDAPDEFRPERFLQRPADGFDFIPQGGGNARKSHRCPGEGVAVALMKVALRFLCTRLDHEVLPQDLRLDHERLPPVPREGFVIRVRGLRKNGAC